MGIIENVKDIASTIHKIGTIDLRKQIQQLQQQVQELVDENGELRKRAREAENLFEVEQQLEFAHNAYWRTIEGGDNQGPYCSSCFDANGKLIRMHISSDPDYAICPSCDREVNFTGHNDATLEQIPPSL